MQVYKPSYVFRRRFTIARLIFAWMAIVAVVAAARGQEPSPPPSARTIPHKWHKYVNQQYGFSFAYPTTYRPVPPADTDGRCRKTENYGCLLWLARRDDPEAIIWVGLSAQPFRLHPGSGDLMPTRQKIGRHVFY